MNINEGLLRNVNAASGGREVGRGSGQEDRPFRKQPIRSEAFYKLCQIFLSCAMAMFLGASLLLK
jgi:hypothetical protein